MVVALLAVASLNVAAYPVQDASLSQVQRLRSACVSTMMNREAFKQAFAESGFEPLIPVVRRGESSPVDWMDGYEDAGVQIVLSGSPNDVSDATDCGLLNPRPVGDWRGEMDALAQELHMTPTTSETMPNVTEAKSWTTAGERPLSLHYEVYRETVIVRFAKPLANSQ